MSDPLDALLAVVVSALGRVSSVASAALSGPPGGLCACGCGRTLGKSPSAWFYDQDCRTRWQSSMVEGNLDRD